MSVDTQETTEMGTKPVAEHAWLQKLVGEWRVASEFVMEPGGPIQKSEGSESVRSLGGLWACGEAQGRMPDGTPFTLVRTLGYDVSSNEYRGCWFGSMTSHLWTSVGTLSDDGKTMTLDGEGPSMVEDGETARYRDVMEIVDEDRHVVTSYGQDDEGEWQEMIKATYTRA